MRTFVWIVTAVLTVACSRRDKTTTEEPSSDTTTIGETTITAATAEARPTDQELIRRIESAIASDPGLSIMARNVEVDAVDGYVALKGSVDSQLTKDAIEREVARTPGVKTTLNKLDVRVATEAETDDTIAFTIQRALVSDPTLAAERDNVTIDVNSGIVTLRGTVSSPEARTTIERAIERKPGVVVVNNRLATGS